MKIVLVLEKTFPFNFTGLEGELLIVMSTMRLQVRGLLSLLVIVVVRRGVLFLVQYRVVECISIILEYNLYLLVSLDEFKCALNDNNMDKCCVCVSY